VIRIAFRRLLERCQQRRCKCPCQTSGLRRQIEHTSSNLNGIIPHHIPSSFTLYNCACSSHPASLSISTKEEVRQAHFAPLSVRRLFQYSTACFTIHLPRNGVIQNSSALSHSFPFGHKGLPAKQWESRTSKMSEYSKYDTVCVWKWLVYCNYTPPNGHLNSGV